MKGEVKSGSGLEKEKYKKVLSSLKAAAKALFPLLADPSSLEGLKELKATTSVSEGVISKLNNASTELFIMHQTLQVKNLFSIIFFSPKRLCKARLK